MSYCSYTAVECTNPELISSGSTLVKELKAELIDVSKGKSYFLSRLGTLDEEIISLSLKFPEETFKAKCHWDHLYFDRITYFFEYKNGECKETARKPGYVFIGPEVGSPDGEHFSAFREHVLQYLRRLDIVKGEEEGFRIDQLNCDKDKHGYYSYITITYENDRYKWTATKKGISYILVSFEKKEPQKHNSGEKTDLIELLGCTDDDGLPF